MGLLYMSKTCELKSCKQASQTIAHENTLEFPAFDGDITFTSPRYKSFKYLATNLSSLVFR